MASVARTATPPPLPELRTPPPAPRFGSYHDGLENYVRKSARISSQRRDTRTPSPHSSHFRHSPSQSSKRSSRTNSSTMASPEASPQKKRQPAPDYVRRASGKMAADSKAKGPAAARSKDKLPRNTDFSTATSMLPTPSKTPQKPPSQETSAHIKSFARNLFGSDESDTLAPRAKRPKHYSGMTMESFTAEEEEDPIEIYTDSQDRIPERDGNPSNPFYGDATSAPSPAKSRSKRQSVRIPGEGLVPVEEANQRDDGMVFVFRGKKFWRKASGTNSQSEDEGDAQPTPRSRAKGKLLFPKHKTNEMLEDEEATTDMEDHLTDSAETPPQTPTKMQKRSIKTPQTPRFAPVSPPSTKRTTRSTNKLADEESPMKGASKRVGDRLTESRAKRIRS